MWRVKTASTYGEVGEKVENRPTLQCGPENSNRFLQYIFKYFKVINVQYMIDISQEYSIIIKNDWEKLVKKEHVLAYAYYYARQFGI